MAVPPGSRTPRYAIPRALNVSLSRLTGSFGTLQDDQFAARGRHPRVMIELVAPFRMPSVIQLFTCSIVLSKFSCAEIARW